jgi:hypothetical protein
MNGQPREHRCRFALISRTERTRQMRMVAVGVDASPAARRDAHRYRLAAP